MNIGSIKSFLSGQDAVKPDVALDKQLQESGLRQAREFYQQTEGSISSRFSVAYSVLSESMRQNVKLDGQNPERAKSVKEQQPEQESFFDFEEVANNVMNFVGRVIRGAAESGADDETLSSLFEQARDGISRGIGAARKDLSGFMNNELSEGIDKVSEELDDRMTQLEKELFEPTSVTELSAVSIQASRGAEFSVRTRDGDEVLLSFGEAQSLSFAQQTSTQEYDDVDEGSYVSQQSSTYISYLQQLGVSLSVTGDIDEDELKAITELVEQVADVADEFFNGDVTQAFEQALSLGYDDSELVGFSVQLIKSQSVSAVRAYESIQNYAENDKPDVPGADRQSIRQYVDKMLDSMDQASKLLSSNDDYNSVVNGIVNSMNEEVKTPDLVSAINRFHRFNEKIIDSVAEQNEG